MLMRLLNDLYEVTYCGSLLNGSFINCVKVTVISVLSLLS